MKMAAPWTRLYSHSFCLCCHVRTGTILLGVWYLIINAVVLLILLSALADPDQYHFSGSELGGEFDFMDDASKYPIPPPSFPYRDDIMSVNPTCLVLIILLFISIILTFKGYLISCVWNCYRYINGRNASDVLVYVTSNDTTVLLPPYDDAPVVTGPAKEPPPPYVSA
nr:lysosomal-associated transmembrane protein 4B [Meriones unguiculatus]